MEIFNKHVISRVIGQKEVVLFEVVLFEVVVFEVESFKDLGEESKM